MAFTYTDYTKTMLHTWGRFRVTLLEAVSPGDLLSWYNTDASYTVQWADQSDSQAADCIACEYGEAGDEIWACLKAECKAFASVGTGGAVTQNYFATSTDFFGAPLYLGEDGKPSSTQGTTFTQVVGKLLARDRILLDLAPTSIGPITETLSGSSALDAVRINVTDTTTASTTSYTRSLYVNHTSTGAKTGSAEVNAVGIDVNATANVNHMFAVSLYTGGNAGATVNHVAGIYMYIDTSSGTVAQKHGIWLQMCGGATQSDFLTLHHQGGTIRSLICTRSTGVTSTNFLKMYGAQLPFTASGCNVSGAGSSEAYLAVDVAGTAYGIPLIAI